MIVLKIALQLLVDQETAHILSILCNWCKELGMLVIVMSCLVHRIYMVVWSALYH